MDHKSSLHTKCKYIYFSVFLKKNISRYYKSVTINRLVNHCQNCEVLIESPLPFNNNFSLTSFECKKFTKYIVLYPHHKDFYNNEAENDFFYHQL